MTNTNSSTRYPIAEAFASIVAQVNELNDSVIRRTDVMQEACDDD